VTRYSAAKRWKRSGISRSGTHLLALIVLHLAGRRISPQSSCDRPYRQASSERKESPDRGSGTRHWPAPRRAAESGSARAPLGGRAGGIGQSGEPAKGGARNAGETLTLATPARRAGLGLPPSPSSPLPPPPRGSARALRGGGMREREGSWWREREGGRWRREDGWWALPCSFPFLFCCHESRRPAGSDGIAPRLAARRRSRACGGSPGLAAVRSASPGLPRSGSDSDPTPFNARHGTNATYGQ
jgi:hypothetical protein